MTAPIGELDRQLDRFLAPGEQVLSAVHQHWATLLTKGASAVGLLVLAFFIDITAPGTSAGRSAANIGWLLALAGLVWLGWGLLNWRYELFVVTDKRLIKYNGLLRSKVAMMPMVKVTDMTYDRSPLALILGYGTFILESAGNEQAFSRVDFVPYPQEQYNLICEVLFGPNPPRRWWPGSWGPYGRGRRDGGPEGEGPGPEGYGPDGYGPGAPPPGGAGGGTDPDQAPHIIDDRPRGHHERYPRGADLPPARPYEPEHRRPDPDDVFDYETADQGESLYRSEDLLRAEHEADTGEIPVIRARPMPPSSW